jgi:alkylhydroperoxidase/carboxymuconolactone decarboxylase family protein YurZ
LFPVSPRKIAIVDPFIYNLSSNNLGKEEQMAENPLAALEDLDPELLKRMQNDCEFAYRDGALPKKTKLLIAMSLDAAAGTAPGTASLARQAMQAGATKQEIAEALRVTHLISGAGSIYTAAAALKML